MFVNYSRTALVKFMKILFPIVRILMGALYLFGGAAVLFGLVEQPELTGSVKVFMDGVIASGYLLTLIKVTEIVCGIAFITNRFVPLAAVIIAPVTINIVLFHLFLDRAGLPVAVFLLVANLMTAYVHRERYRGLFVAK